MRINTPRFQVTGVVDDPQRVLEVLDSLTTAGFTEEFVGAFAGEEALAAVDPTGTQHGLLGRLVRGLEQFGQESEEHREATNELRAGHALVAVKVSSEQEKERVAQLLKEQGVHRLRYWGRWDIEEL